MFWWQSLRQSMQLRVGIFEYKLKVKTCACVACDCQIRNLHYVFRIRWFVFCGDFWFTYWKQRFLAHILLILLFTLYVGKVYKRLTAIDIVYGDIKARNRLQLRNCKCIRCWQSRVQYRELRYQQLHILLMLQVFV